MSDQDFRERVLESLSRIEAQAKENSTRLGTLERDVGWIKGKLDGTNWKFVLRNSIYKVLIIFLDSHPKKPLIYLHADTQPKTHP